MPSIEETLKREGKMAAFHKRHVDDTLTMTSDTTSATTFLHILNNCHSSAKLPWQQRAVVRISFLIFWYAATKQSHSKRDQSLRETYEHGCLVPLPEPC